VSRQKVTVDKTYNNELKVSAELNHTISNFIYRVDDGSITGTEVKVGFESSELDLGTVVRQAHQPWFDRFTNHGSTGSPTMVRQAHQPWFDRLTSHSEIEELRVFH